MASAMDLLRPTSGSFLTLRICAVVGGSIILSSRYPTSATPERPVLFSIFTLLWLGAGLAICTAWTGRDRHASLCHFADRPSRLCAISSRARVLLGCVVGRTLLYARAVRWTQCSIEGLFTFLPAVVTLYGPCEMTGQQETSSKLSGHPASKTPLEPDSIASRPFARRIKPVLRRLVFAFAWGFSAQKSLALTERSTGAVCPANAGLARLIPAGQAVMLCMDALVLMQVTRLRRRQGDMEAQSSNWACLAAVSLSSALVLAVTLVIASLFPLESLGWSPNHYWIFLRDLMLDSAVAGGALLAGISLLASMQPGSLALLVGAVCICSDHISRMVEEHYARHVSTQNGWAVSAVGLLATLSVLALHHEERVPGSRSQRAVRSGLLQRQLTGCFSVMAVALLVCGMMTSSRQPPGLLPLISAAWTDSEAWMAKANRSKGLPEAVAEYEKRYGIPPPPHFDRWYQFATNQKSLVIDSFDQIFEDLTPFWAISPAILRDRTSHLMEQTKLGIGGFRIKNGTVELSPLTPGTHFWMMEGLKAMVEPFVQWLPDMDLAFNLDDECRVAVPMKHLQVLHGVGRQSRERLAKAQALRGFSDTRKPPWASRYLEPGFKEEAGHVVSPLFSKRPKVPIYDSFVAPTCPAASRARTERWWSRRNARPEGRGLVEDWSLANDLCARPDIARMHGFLLDPGSFAVTRLLFPVFSQGRVSGFNDILVPSPWNFMGKVQLDEARDYPWKDKLNSLFWRGASSDGLSRDNSWTGYLRARFVHLANSRPLSWGKSLGAVSSPPSSSSAPSRLARSPDNVPVQANVTFVGEFMKCGGGDCPAETATFYGYRKARPPPNVDFQEHWRHRHLMDLDGAGFSGRFLPFMKSRSLVYRASLFRAWYDERTHPWRHYVPLDISLAELWDLVAFFGGRTAPATEKPAGSYGEIIAEEGGRWARGVLREEDMQIYMFRLLLEWGRLVDDGREGLGYRHS